MNETHAESSRSTQRAEPGRGSGRLGRLSRFAGIIALILLIWFCILVTVPMIRDGPGQYLVIGPQSERLVGISATDAKLVSEGWGYTQITSSSAHIVSQLYAHGVWLILPASNGGCLSLTDWRRLTSQ